MDLMAVRATKGQSLPLYLSVIDRILRDLRIQHQATNGRFNYGMFKQKIDQADLTDAQLAPLQQRLETLESFMVQREALSYDLFRTKATANKKSATKGTTWAAEVCDTHFLFFLLSVSSLFHPIKLRECRVQLLMMDILLARPTYYRGPVMPMYIRGDGMLSLRHLPEPLPRTRHVDREGDRS